MTPLLSHTCASDQLTHFEWSTAQVTKHWMWCWNRYANGDV